MRPYLIIIGSVILQNATQLRFAFCLSAERLKTQAGVPIEWDARSSGSLRIRGPGLFASDPLRTIDLANGEAPGRDRTQPARGTESLLNREESGRIGDLQDWSLSPLPRVERIGPPTREFAAISGL